MTKKTKPNTTSDMIIKYSYDVPLETDEVSAIVSKEMLKQVNTKVDVLNKNRAKLNDMQIRLKQIRDDGDYPSEEELIDLEKDLDKLKEDMIDTSKINSIFNQTVLPNEIILWIEKKMRCRLIMNGFP